MKTCKVCLIEKPLTDFYFHKNSKDGCLARCKKCISDQRKVNYSPDKALNAVLKSRYGISKEQYESKLEAQNHQCAICRTTDPGKYHGRFCVDHNPLTNEVRGLICHNCNSALGNFKDNALVLLNAVNYLNQYGSYG